tara:strand:- start:594 stop:1208 length:615 start_codon:yes stop_codon:yes gene_type:complete
MNQFKITIKIFLLLFLWIMVSGGWLDFFKSSKERWSGESPIAFFERATEPFLKVFGNSRDSASKLIDMSIFGGLHPSIIAIGDPVLVGDPIIDRPEPGQERYTYKTDRGKLIHFIFSPDFEHTVTELFFIPFDRRPESILSEKITRYLRPNIKAESVLIYNCDDNRYQFNISFEEGLIDKIGWSDPTPYNQSFGRTKRGACIGE